MTDREKVIKGLEEVIAEAVYPDRPRRFMMPMGLAERVLGLLKAQEPMKPVPAIDDDGDWLCGNCYQSVVGEEELDASGFVPVKFNFCPNCGRAVKWE